MKIKFHSPKELDRNLKVSIHRSGKMGFTVDTANKLKLSVGKSAAIGTNEDDTNDDSLFLVIYPDVQENTFRVSKAGGYYYINTKPLFDTLKIDYTNGDIVYDVNEKVIEGETMYHLKKRNNVKKATEQI